MVKYNNNNNNNTTTTTKITNRNYVIKKYINKPHDKKRYHYDANKGKYRRIRGVKSVKQLNKINEIQKQADNYTKEDKELIFDRVYKEYLDNLDYYRQDNELIKEEELDYVMLKVNTENLVDAENHTYKDAYFNFLIKYRGVKLYRGEVVLDQQNYNIKTLYKPYYKLFNIKQYTIDQIESLLQQCNQFFYNDKLRPIVLINNRMSLQDNYVIRLLKNRFNVKQIYYGYTKPTQSYKGIGLEVEKEARLNPVDFESVQFLFKNKDSRTINQVCLKNFNYNNKLINLDISIEDIKKSQLYVDNYYNKNQLITTGLQVYRDIDNKYIYEDRKCLKYRDVKIQLDDLVTSDLIKQLVSYIECVKYRYPNVVDVNTCAFSRIDHIEENDNQLIIFNNNKQKMIIHKDQQYMNRLRDNRIRYDEL
jgi:hypothetical protein